MSLNHLYYFCWEIYIPEGVEYRTRLTVMKLLFFLDFDMYVAHIDFARKYEHMGRHKKALKEYKAALEIDSRDEGLLEKN